MRKEEGGEREKKGVKEYGDSAIYIHGSEDVLDTVKWNVTYAFKGVCVSARAGEVVRSNVHISSMFNRKECTEDNLCQREEKGEGKQIGKEHV